MSINVSMFTGEKATSFRPKFSDLSINVRPVRGVYSVVAPPLFRLLAFTMFPMNILIKGIINLLEMTSMVRVGTICVVAKDCFFCST